MGVTFRVRCSGKLHRIYVDAEREILAFLDHDMEREKICIELGGNPSRCYHILDDWRNGHVPDISNREALNEFRKWAVKRDEKRRKRRERRKGFIDQESYLIYRFAKRIGLEELILVSWNPFGVREIYAGHTIRPEEMLRSWGRVRRSGKLPVSFITRRSMLVEFNDREAIIAGLDENGYKFEIQIEPQRALLFLRDAPGWRSRVMRQVVQLELFSEVGSGVSVG